MFDFLIYFNMFLALVAIICNVVYFIMAKEYWRWIKLAFAFNALVVLLVYISLVLGNPVDQLMIRIVFTLLLMSKVSAAITGLAKQRLEKVRIKNGLTARK